MDTDEILGPVEFCREVKQLQRDHYRDLDATFPDAWPDAWEDFFEGVAALLFRLRIITVKEVYAALGEGFPEGGTCHIGWSGEGPVQFEPTVEHEGHVYLVCSGGREWLPLSGTWVSEGADISDEPARSFVKLLGTEFAAKLAELEAGQ